MTVDECTLLAQVAAGDEAALHTLYVAYRPRLRQYLWYQLAGDAAQVDDALQETFLAVWRSAPQYRGDAQVSTWLFRLAHHTASHMRRYSLRHPADTMDSLLADEDAAPEITMEAAVLDRLELAAALARLSPKHRAALDLVCAQGFSLEEAATILDTPVGTVKSRLSYARRALLAALRSQETEVSRHDA